MCVKNEKCDIIDIISPIHLSANTGACFIYVLGWKYMPVDWYALFIAYSAINTMYNAYQSTNIYFRPKASMIPVLWCNQNNLFIKKRLKTCPYSFAIQQIDFDNINMINVKIHGIVYILKEH